LLFLFQIDGEASRASGGYHRYAVMENYYAVRHLREFANWINKKGDAMPERICAMMEAAGPVEEFAAGGETKLLPERKTKK